MGHPGFFKTYKETKDWLDQYGIKRYVIDPATLEVDVHGSSDLDISTTLDYIPVQFRNTDGYFSLSWCRNLLSLKGCPIKVEGAFYINGCESLITLEHFPKCVLLVQCTDCDSLISHGYIGEVKGSSIPTFSDIIYTFHKKYRNYIRYLRGLSSEEKYDSILWLHKADLELYLQFMGYEQKHNYQNIFSKDAQRIANLELHNTNHRM